MELNKIASLKKKIEDVILNEDVTCADIIATIALFCGDLVETAVTNNYTTREKIVAVILECITESCKPDEEDNTPQD